MSVQIDGAMGVFGDLASVMILHNRTVVLCFSGRVGEVFDVIAHRHHQLIGDKPLVHQIQREHIGHLPQDKPCLLRIVGTVKHLPGA